MCVPVIHVNNNPAYNLKRNTYKSKKERNEAVLKISEIVTEDIIKHSKFNIPYGSVIVIKDYIQPQIINPEGVVSYVYKCSKWNYDDGVFIWDLKKACPLEYYDEDEGWFNRLIVPPTFEISDLCTILTPISYFNTFCLRRVEKSIWFTPEILHRMFFTYEKVYTKHEGKIVEDDFEEHFTSFVVIHGTIWKIFHISDDEDVTVDEVQHAVRNNMCTFWFFDQNEIEMFINETQRCPVRELDMDVYNKYLGIQRDVLQNKIKEIKKCLKLQT
jgi:hypothetical protein